MTDMSMLVSQDAYLLVPKDDLGQLLWEACRTRKWLVEFEDVLRVWQQCLDRAKDLTPEQRILRGITTDNWPWVNVLAWMYLSEFSKFGLLLNYGDRWARTVNTLPGYTVMWGGRQARFPFCKVDGGGLPAILDAKAFWGLLAMVKHA